MKLANAAEHILQVPMQSVTMSAGGANLNCSDIMDHT